VNSSRHLIISLTALCLIVLIGTAGYMAIEGWEPFDGLYMTIITLTTVGYGEVHRITKTGRVFTIFLIVVGGGLNLYVTAALVQFFVEGRIRLIMGRRRIDRKIKIMKNHYIICGYGRIGRVLCQNLSKKPKNVVVIEKSQDLIPTMEKDRVPYISDDASKEHVLIQAGIKEAKALVAALATDIDNVFLVLTARQLNPDIFIMARSSHHDTRQKLFAAGANRVESPYEIGAVRMAMRLTRPNVTSFLDYALGETDKRIQMDEIVVTSHSPLIGQTLKDSGIRQQFDIMIIAIQKEDGRMLFNPSFESVFESGDTVIAVGVDDNLSRFEKVLAAPINK